jgi:hypothetical protein
MRNWELEKTTVRMLGRDALPKVEAMFRLTAK